MLIISYDRYICLFNTQTSLHGICHQNSELNIIIQSCIEPFMTLIVLILVRLLLLNSPEHICCFETPGWVS